MLAQFDHGATTLVAIGVFVVGMIIIGAVAARRATEAQDFLVAGRSLPLWLCTATLTATWMGAGTVIGAAGAAYQDGILGTIADPFGAALCLAIAGMFYVRTLRRMELLTIADFFQLRYSPWCGLLSSGALMTLYVGWTAVQFKAFGVVAGSLIDADANTAIIVGAVIILIYTALGGMWAVALTDAVQVVILLVGLATILPMVIINVGGIDAALGQVEGDKLRILPAEATPLAWIEYLRGWLIIGIGSIATQDLMQRSFSARSEAIAQNSAYLASGLYLTFGMIPVVLGLIGSQVLPGLDDPELVVPELAAKYLHPVLTVFFIGALLAAVMSSADSALLAPASLLSANIIPFFRPGISERDSLSWARWSIPVLGLVSLVIALNAEAIFDLMLSSFEMPLVSLFAAFTAGIWWRGANATGALASMIIGPVVWIVCLSQAPEYPAELIGLGASIVALVVGSIATRSHDPPRALTNRDGAAINLNNRLGLFLAVTERNSADER